MATGYLMGWTETERGWGNRPDGYSLHLSEQDCRAYIADYWRRMPDRVNSQAPDEYSHPDGDKPVAVEVETALAARLAQEKSIRFFGRDLLVEQEPTGRRTVRLRAPDPKTPQPVPESDSPDAWL